MTKEDKKYFESKFQIEREYFESKFQEEREYIDKRFEKVEMRLDKIEGRLDRVEERLNNIEERLERIEDRVKYHDKMFMAVQNDFNKFSNRIEIIWSKVEEEIYPAMVSIRNITDIHTIKLGRLETSYNLRDK